MARSPQQDLLLVILLMAALGAAWYYTGGTANDFARSGPLFTMPKVGGGALPVFSIPGVKQNNNPGAGTLVEPQTTSVTNYIGTFTEEKSPYAQYVSLEEGNARSSFDGEYLTLRISSNASQKITVSGWRVDSTATGYTVSLPLASELPFLGGVNSTGPVSLSQGQTAYIVTGRSPNGTSFRTNMCTGYFEQFQNFTPSLNLECPTPQTESDTYFAPGTLTNECFDIIRSLGRCTLVVQSVPLSAGPMCEQFITNTLSYNGCINKHKNDPKFYKEAWYLYLNRDQELWRSRSERIRLLDENGKVVDTVSY
jgi:hypothetical protein